MMQRFFQSNAAQLASLVLERGLTIREAATAAGLSAETFSNLIRRDKRISFRTAGKLSRAFGATSVNYVLKGGEENDG